MRSHYRKLVQDLALPQFFDKSSGSVVFGNRANEALLDRVILLKGFKPADKNTQIALSLTGTRAYAIDIEIDWAWALDRFVDVIRRM